MQPAHADLSEILFGFDELFFSRTDRSGIIRFGNEVFQRIAGYNWDELLNKPHKIIRHPDTPRAVFWALWDFLKRDLPIGAYVKNRAKDGRHYWVFAIATPIEGGYLSVRLRPSSEILDTVKLEYAALVELERRDRLAPADSAGLLLGRLAELGFPDYPSFMAAALGRELAARDEQLGSPCDRRIARFQELLRLARTLLRQARVISEAYDFNEHVPLNFRIMAAQLGQAGASIDVISANYGQLSAEMKSILDRFIAGAEGVFCTINEGYFLACTARIQREMSARFKAETGGDSSSAATEALLLDGQQRDYAARALAGLQEISTNARAFQHACLDMSRLAAGMEATRVMGKVECARHAGAADRLGELLSDLESYQRTVSAAMKEIAAMNALIVGEAGDLMQSAPQAA